MTALTTEPLPDSPAEERRGGEAPDWDRALPGETLPDSGPDEAAVPESAVRIPGHRPYTRHGPADWCGHPRCGGD